MTDDDKDDDIQAILDAASAFQAEAGTDDVAAAEAAAEARENTFRLRMGEAQFNLFTFDNWVVREKLGNPFDDKFTKQRHLFSRRPNDEFKRYLDHNHFAHHGEFFSEQLDIQLGIRRPTFAELLSGSVFFNDSIYQDIILFCRQYSLSVPDRLSAELDKFNKSLINGDGVSQEDNRRKLDDCASVVVRNLNEIGNLSDFHPTNRDVDLNIDYLTKLNAIYFAYNAMWRTSFEKNKYMIFDIFEFTTQLQIYLAFLETDEVERIRHRSDLSALCMQRIYLTDDEETRARLFKGSLGWMRSNIFDITRNTQPENTLEIMCMSHDLLDYVGQYLDSVGRPKRRNPLRNKVPWAQAEVVSPEEEIEKRALGIKVIDKFNKASMSNQRNASEIENLYKPMAEKKTPLRATPDLRIVRKTMMEQFPQAEGIIDTLLKDIAGRRDEFGQHYVFFKPTLLLGEPGSGKSYFCRQLAEALGIPSLLYNCGGMNDSMFIGNSHNWGGASPSIPLQTIAQQKLANPIIILDEIEKIASSTHNGNLHQALLNLLEPTSAEKVHDYYLSSAVNLSKVNYLFTANSAIGIDAPLKNRLRILKSEAPSVEHLPIILPGLVKRIAADQGLDPAWFSPLNVEEREAIVSIWQKGSIRNLNRIVETILSARDYPAVKHS